MDFYTMVLRKSGNDWVALCLENGLVGQGMTKEDSIRKLKEAIECFEDVRKTEEGVYSAPISIKELHEFLTIFHGSKRIVPALCPPHFQTVRFHG